MNIWMKHSIHGVKKCYAQGEVDADLKNGWVVFDPTVKVVPVVQEVVAEVPEVAVDDEDESAPISRKRGRPARDK